MKKLSLLSLQRSWSILLHPVSGASRSLFVSGLSILASGFSTAQTLPLTQEELNSQLHLQAQPHFERLPTGEKMFSWLGQSGFSYFIQASPDLLDWTWAPNIEPGVDAPMSYEVDGPTAAGFFRLIRTDQTAADLDAADFDNDGLSNNFELTPRPRPGGVPIGFNLKPNIQTNPLKKDTDGDGLSDKWELEHGLDPTDNGSREPKNGPSGDQDEDGASNLDEHQAKTSPNNPADFPPQMICAYQTADGSGTLQGGFYNFSHTSINQGSRWFTPVGKIFDLRGQDFSIALLEGISIFRPFPVLPTDLSVNKSGLVVTPLRATSCSAIYQPNGYFFASGYMSRERVWLKVPPKPEVQEFTFLKVTEKRNEPEVSSSTSHAAEVVKITILPNQTYSEALDIIATPEYDIENTSITTCHLIPMSKAPEVLAVNSNFDEGRIDPITGYAVPDCDDSTSLTSARSHLDGRFPVNTAVTDDLHRGWFGIPRNSLPDSFWEGSTISVRKIAKTDPATGFNESGDVRFYAKWGDAYDEYLPVQAYDFETFDPVDLISSGLFGPGSLMPENSEYWMEGVHPGKITLEWRYQKGVTDLRFEQTFEVCTHKTATEWKYDLAYKIRLETSNDPSGIVDVRNLNYPSEAYSERLERISEYYDFYQDCFLSPLRSPPFEPQALSWAGLARLAGNQNLGGLSDSEYGLSLAKGLSLGQYLTPLPVEFLGWPEVLTASLQQELFSGARDIFRSIGWQMHAYRSSGYRAIEWVAVNAPISDPDAAALASSWKDLRISILVHDQTAINAAALEVTNHEQNTVIVSAWNKISTMPASGPVNWIFTHLAKNPCAPAGGNFHDLVPTGSLSNTIDRWDWIDPATTVGILDTWNNLPNANRAAMVGRTSSYDAGYRFSLLSNPMSPFIAGGLPILVWDHEDVK